VVTKVTKSTNCVGEEAEYDVSLPDPMNRLCNGTISVHSESSAAHSTISSFVNKFNIQIISLCLIVHTDNLTVPNGTNR